MAAPKPRSARSTALCDSADSDKLESTTSWDALEWTKIEPLTRSVSHANLDFLLDAERVIVEGYGVVLVNTDEAGTLLSEGTRNIIPLGTIPLATIEKFNKTVLKIQSAPRQTDKTPSQRLLQVIGKDMRIIVFGFRPRTKQRRDVYDALVRCTKPERIWDIYAFISGPSKFINSNPRCGY